MTPPGTAPRKDWVGIVRCGQGLAATLYITNDVGGTTQLPAGTYRVRLLEYWYDDEIGIRCVGELLGPADVEVPGKGGTTGFPPGDYRRYGDEFVTRVQAAARTFDPRRVYFSLD